MVAAGSVADLTSPPGRDQTGHCKGSVHLGNGRRVHLFLFGTIFWDDVVAASRLFDHRAARSCSGLPLVIVIAADQVQGIQTEVNDHLQIAVGDGTCAQYSPLTVSGESARDARMAPQMPSHSHRDGSLVHIQGVDRDDFRKTSLPITLNPFPHQHVGTGKVSGTPVRLVEGG